jgi:colanic acid/amylovoran biosynthesis glycosyltransferase
MRIRPETHSFLLLIDLGSIYQCDELTVCPEKVNPDQPPEPAWGGVYCHMQVTTKMNRNDRILLVLQLPLYRIGDETFIDTQACNGLRLWVENFDAVTLIGPQIIRSEPPADTSNSKTVVRGERLLIVPLPKARSPHRFIVDFSKASSLLWQQIGDANYLHFAIGGVWGDWAAVASIMAHRAGLKYAVWTDRVESTVERFANQSRTGLKKAYRKFCSALMERLERRVIQRSSLGFNGTDCFDAYAPICPKRQHHLA